MAIDSKEMERIRRILMLYKNNPMLKELMDIGFHFPDHVFNMEGEELEKRLENTKNAYNTNPLLKRIMDEGVKSENIEFREFNSHNELELVIHSSMLAPTIHKLMSEKVIELIDYQILSERRVAVWIIERRNE